MSDEINVGLIGYGMAGRVFHAPVIQSVPGLRLKKVVERHGEESRQRYPWVEVVRDAESLLGDAGIELVVVATPNNTHFNLAKQSLLANKHVVVEKPFTLSSAEAQQLINLARERNRVVTAYQNRRWDGDYLTVRKVLEAELLGRLVEYESHFDRFRNQQQLRTWRDEDEEGGILFDLGSHLVDQAQVLFGLPLTITADIRVQRDFARAVDSFELILNYDNLKVTLKSGMLVREPGPRFMLHGTLGSFVKYGLDPQEDALKLGLTPSAPNWGVETHDLWGTLNTQLDELHVRGQLETQPGCYQAYYQNIVEAIRRGTELAVKAEEARNTIRILELAGQSNLEKRTLPYS